VAAARAAFEQKGLDGLSMRDIAKAVGVTPMAIYRHFENKQSLTDMLVLDALDEWSAVVAAIPPAPPLKWLRRIGVAHLDFALLKPRRYEAAFLLHSEKARRYPDDFVAGRSPAGRLQLRLLEELVAQRRLPAHAPVEILIANVGLSQGLITLYRAGRIAGSEPEFRELYLRATHRLMDAFLVEGRE
jgi:AcrR family transcriptional regulator